MITHFLLVLNVSTYISTSQFANQEPNKMNVSTYEELR